MAHHHHHHGSKAYLVGLYTLTPTHPGSGTELGVVDQPIQRERHTGFPVIWGQSLKGVLRSYLKLVEKVDEEKINKIFGPPTEKAHEQAGLISVGDAKILFFPVRSLKGVYAYVTSPLVLNRFKRDLELAGVKNFQTEIPELTDTAIASEEITVDNKVILEEFAILIQKDDKGILESVVKAIEQAFGNEMAEKIKGRIAIIPDDVFRDLVELSTEIVARIRINAETGTVETGGLWYEEYIPSDTLFYSLILVTPRAKDNDMALIKEVLGKINGKYLQIGGNETVGKGFVKVTLKEVTNNGGTHAK
uniref:CRISPR system Cmr subunit Cmr4 n=1 Tax=Pyrococcus furiosus TaxID=2261 RepID=UPI00054CD3A9|nr:Chain A, CRISPR system Cmr subunit Cmr4 [Pyrococcus furiosus]4RDP_B Chain B, CRISPR system Cmr subunit Cmr4 [Pyrococcus furiosus]